ncbi:unnamed protein product [Chondrus crispus]|uniref:Uncharacterized protein n=1 Tax=Chondrus crispus TaxID=2769 RepID=R7Q6R7_CHOCR|nr:unnamed protein product [Chondrus crispus]CDF34237.1 unnamed protein product [Chondrus crispus]|eukprot:XP_005714056.1 unnamed protein product [Chondrus crispus]
MKPSIRGRCLSGIWSELKSKSSCKGARQHGKVGWARFRRDLMSKGKWKSRLHTIASPQKSFSYFWAIHIISFQRCCRASLPTRFPK